MNNLDSLLFKNVEALANYKEGSKTELTDIKNEKTTELIKNINKDLTALCSSLLKDHKFIKKINREDVKTIGLALKNYRLLGFDKIATLDPEFDTIPFHLAHSDALTQEEKNFYSKVEPAMLPELEEAFRTLEKANDSTLDMSTRMHCMPQPTGAQTANGSYFLLTGEDKSFIGKPALQEAGAELNPFDNGQIRVGIEGGQGVIRERLVYKGQQLLGIDCGIPPTVIAEGKNSLLTGEANIKKITEIVDKIQKINPSIRFYEIMNFIKQGKTKEEVVTIIANEEDSLDPFSLSLKNAVQQLKSEKKEVNVKNLMMEMKNHAVEMEEIRKRVDLLKKAVAKEDVIDSLPALVEDLWTILEVRAEGKALMSLQKYVSDCRTLGGALKEQDALPLKEIHKFIIDLIFFNTDRNLSNALIKEGSVILIDHGSCLPNPSEEQDCKGLEQAVFEFLELPQTAFPLEASFAKAIEKLNIEEFIENLKQDQIAHQDKFGPLCAVEEKCYNLLRLNLYLVKAGVELGATVKQMGTFQAQLNDPTSGQLIKFYRHHMANKDIIDWGTIEKEMNKSLESYIQSKGVL